MDSINTQQVAREVHRMQDNREELVERLACAIREDGTVQPLKGIHLYRFSSPTASVPGMFDPAFCVIAQGSKEIHLGEECYRYDPYHYCLGTVELPVVSQVIEASPERPYLSLRLDLDPILVSSVMVEAGHFAPSSHAGARAIHVHTLDANLLDVVVRLARLLDSPAAARFLTPLITRELIYWLLMGKQGVRLRHMALLGGNSERVIRAIQRLRDEFDQPLRIDDIAREVGMSVSGFHHHFKAVTGMSPLQFQKQQRLQEARRLMLSEQLDAASTAYRVGYDNASHFNREYKRLFGEPPMRDVERLQRTAGESVAL